jgi:hypothetical protein
MARDYQAVLRSGKGVWVPQWIIIALAILFFGTLALRILKPPQWNLQRLDSPDGSMSAELWQTKYLHYAYRVKVKHGAIWRTIYNSSEFEPDFSVNYRPTLYWDSASEFLLFTVEGNPVILYDAQKQQTLNPSQAKSVLLEHFSDHL